MLVKTQNSSLSVKSTTVLKFEFKPFIYRGDEEKCIAEYPFLGLLLAVEEGIRSFKLKNLEEFHLIGVDIADGYNFVGKEKFLGMIAENFPKLQLLCLTCQNASELDDWNDISQEFASEKNIKLEFSSVSTCSCGHASLVQPSMEMETKIFSPR